MSIFPYLLVRLFIGCFSLLPLNIVYSVSDMLYLLLRYVLKYRRNVIHKNLTASFPDKDSREIDSFINQYYRYLADLIVETIKGYSFSKSEWTKRFRYHNPEIFDDLYQEGKGVILLGSHYGNWEWGGISFPLVVKQKVVGVYKPVKNRKIEEYLNSLRERHGLHLTKMHHVGRYVVQHRDQAVIFVFIADQTPVDVRNAHWLTFLHQDTPFLHGAARLAKQTGYPVFHYRINRVKRGYYEVVFEKLCDEDTSLTPPEITARYAGQLEKMIAQNPPYWLWSHRRWKRQRPVVKS